ncbi:DUF4124 domain-containing protein [Luteimonas sp. FCS-9]|uniref:DUF4124 domain-containing protein n=1 Tax=Luteimonas sp. FCS-9 TaxID=1547516 RepID=UPI00063E79E7|nr:DUF4124 domain-containing protein [Luteimonas sp. FCS-9]KLJ00100.1 hypothetical protein WQ56_10305 [Luteimonas sp. FCS-9]
MRLVPSLLVLTACAAGVSSPAAARDDVVVYRCTDARGQVALRDSPCTDGHRQEVRTMTRPVDAVPAPRPAVPATTAAAAPAPPPPQVVVVRPPMPMYRCVRPDGSQYTSDSSEGNPRWVPLWTMGYGPPRRGPSTRIGVEAGTGGGRLDVDIDARRPVRGGYGGAGTWIRDDCRPLPQAEVCSLLADRREEIRRRFFNAQPSERARLRGEETAINARLGQDCGR